MLDFSWSELLVVIIVAVIAIGPKQLPEMMYGLGRIVRRIQYMKYALTRQFDDFMDESELRRFREDPRVQSTSAADEAEDDEEAVMTRLPPSAPVTSSAQTETPAKPANNDPDHPART